MCSIHQIVNNSINSITRQVFFYPDLCSLSRLTFFYIDLTLFQYSSGQYNTVFCRNSFSTRKNKLHWLPRCTLFDVPTYRAFSHDVTATMLVFLNKETFHLWEMNSFLLQNFPILWAHQHGHENALQHKDCITVAQQPYRSKVNNSNPRGFHTGWQR